MNDYSITEDARDKFQKANRPGTGVNPLGLDEIV